VKVFLDANILLSASAAQSLCGKFIRGLAGKSDLVTSAYCIQEARKNIHKFRNASAGDLESLVTGLQVCDEGETLIEVPHLPAKDLPVLAAAIHAGCTHLATGDLKHFGTLIQNPIASLRVVTLAMLAKEIQSRTNW
jgi:uncharacterized protein